MNLRYTLCSLLCAFSFLLLTASPLIAETKDSEVSDTWLQAKLVTMYTLNSNLSIFDIDVDVADRVARLSGTVDSEVEKELAKELAKSVSGIESVDNAIVVEKRSAENRPENTSNSFFRTVRDLTTTAQIKSELLANTAVSGVDIGVSTENSVVTLSGAVPSEKHADLAEQIAQNAEGVTQVNNNLKVTS